MTRKHDKIEKKQQKNKKLDGNLFKSDKVVQFFNEIDQCCREGLESVYCDFQDFSNPIVRTPDMQQFIEQMPSVFGETWNHLCKLRGVKENHKMEKEKKHTS